MRYSFSITKERIVHFCMTCSVSQELQLFAEELQRHVPPTHLQHVAREVGFVKRSSKYRAQDLAALCVWISQSVAQTSLTQLCSGLEAATGILMGPEGLNQRFNTTAIEFLRHILTQLLTQKLSASRIFSSQYVTTFQWIRILDSTAFQLPNAFASVYPGAGRCIHKDGIKIQLEYGLLSRQFLHIHTGLGKQHDRTYGSLCVPSVETNDLCIRNLGYFHIKDLQHIQEKQAYYISRIKSNTRIYQKNPRSEYFQQNGRIKKSQYIQLDMEDLMDTLQPGQTYEIPDAYIGMTEKLPARVIVHRLTLCCRHSFLPIDYSNIVNSPYVCTGRQRRKKRVFVTTDTELKVIAPPASIEFKSPSVATGIKTTL